MKTNGHMHIDEFDESYPPAERGCPICTSQFMVGQVKWFPGHRIQNASMVRTISSVVVEIHKSIDLNRATCTH
jgi:hypothetical protein